ncbi:MAG: hypothetical protein L3K26_19355, partial [Candidatus Hydrogenedentes bacterium]|nr:hypothetical protein [Candidatus Hydrogenedentota bacterium]
DDVTLFPGMPKFMGYIPQQFRVYRGEPTRTSKQAMPGLERDINSEVVARLREVDAVLAPGKTGALKLGQVKEFPHATEAQRQGVPMWEVDKGSKEQLSQAREVFLEIADAIIDKG